MAINQLTNLDYYTQNKKHKLVLTTLTHFITYIFTFLKKRSDKGRRSSFDELPKI